MPEIAGEYVTTRQAAELAGVSQSHVWTLIRKGAVAGERVGYVWLVSVPSLERYLANRPKPGLRKGQKINRPSKSTKS